MDHRAQAHARAHTYSQTDTHARTHAHTHTHTHRPPSDTHTHTESDGRKLVVGDELKEEAIITKHPDECDNNTFLRLGEAILLVTPIHEAADTPVVL